VISKNPLIAWAGMQVAFLVSRRLVGRFRLAHNGGEMLITFT
jgi:hypothetical protein